MPTNSNYDGYFTGIGDVSIFTYGMITITAVVLSYMTYMDTYIPDDISKPVLEATSVDGLIQSNPSETVGTIPQDVLQDQPSLTQEPVAEEEQEPTAEPSNEPTDQPSDVPSNEATDEIANESGERNMSFQQENDMNNLQEYEEKEILEDERKYDDEDEDEEPQQPRQPTTIQGGSSRKKRITRKSKPSGKKR
jgi:hypothetical protein